LEVLLYYGRCNSVLFLLILNWGWIGDMPDLDDIENPTASLASQVYAQDGTPWVNFI
jgi:penicillin-binding protein 1A